jgi:hypothetical protein
MFNKISDGFEHDRSIDDPRLISMLRMQLYIGALTTFLATISRGVPLTFACIETMSEAVALLRQTLDAYSTQSETILTLLGQQGHVSDVKTAVDSLVETDTVLLQTLDALATHQAIQGRVARLEAAIAQKDHTIASFGHNIATLESSLFDAIRKSKEATTATSNTTNVVGEGQGESQSLPTAHDVLVLAERLALMSHAPAYRMRSGMDGFAVTKPPGPQVGQHGGSVDNSRLHMTVEELAEIAGSKAKTVAFLTHNLSETIAATVVLEDVTPIEGKTDVNVKASSSTSLLDTPLPGDATAENNFGGLNLSDADDSDIDLDDVDVDALF